MLSSDLITILTILVGLGFLLVLMNNQVVERFTSSINPNTNPIACGVDMTECPHPLKCINGFCRKAAPAVRTDPNPVPLLPDPNPYDFQRNSFYSVDTE